MSFTYKIILILVILVSVSQQSPFVFAEETTVTTYPSKYYNIDSSGKVIKHIFANGIEIATIEDGEVKYLHTDHLGSTNVVTNKNGEIIETLDYFPFGSIKTDNKTGNSSEQRKYIGEEYDESTGLNYLNARYYDSKQGQFLSQDPVFWEMGSNDFKDKYQRTIQEHLMNPQSLNSYSYANNNPVTFSDPEGKIAFIPLVGYILVTYGILDFGIDLYDANTVNVKYPEQFSRQEKIDTAKELAIDVGTFGFGRLVEKGSRVAYDAITTTVEILSKKTSEENAKKSITDKNDEKANPNPLITKPQIQSKIDIHSLLKNNQNTSNTFDPYQNSLNTTSETKQKINNLTKSKK